MAMMGHIICVGGAHWDILGRAERQMLLGDDLPGQITQLVGGVAGPVAIRLVKLGQKASLLCHIGEDAPGRALQHLLKDRGVDIGSVIPSQLPTDIYMAVEAPDGLVAAIADAKGLEACEEEIVAPLFEARLALMPGQILFVDSNLTEQMLAKIGQADWAQKLDLRAAPASSGKVMRLRPLLATGRAGFYVNLREANMLCAQQHETADKAAQAMCDAGAKWACVTNGAAAAAYSDGVSLIQATPPQITPLRFTGAGDAFAAAHIAAQAAGGSAKAALGAAIDEAATHIAGGTL